MVQCQDGAPPNKLHVIGHCIPSSERKIGVCFFQTWKRLKMKTKRQPHEYLVISCPASKLGISSPFSQAAFPLFLFKNEHTRSPALCKVFPLRFCGACKRVVLLRYRERNREMLFMFIYVRLVIVRQAYIPFPPVGLNLTKTTNGSLFVTKTLGLPD